MRNAKKHLNKHPKWDEVCKGLKNVLHDSLTITEFEEAWQDWVKIFKLEKYNWCKDMYDLRHRWVPIYFKDTFWAGMSSTQRSEGMNFFFKGFLNINTTLKQFVEQFGFALAKRVKEEDKETFISSDSPLHCATDHTFEHVFQKLYTSKKFFEFQQGVKDMTYNNATKIFDDEKQCVYDIIVRRKWYGRTKRTIFQVTMEKETLEVRCDCKNFEFKGIMCSHSLRVFHEEECYYVPERYILDRWREDLPREHLKIPAPYYSLLKKKPEEMKRYEKLQNTFEPISTVAMVNDMFYNEVLGALSELIVKSQSITKDEHGLMSQNLTNIGKVYGRRVPKSVVVTQTQDVEMVENNEDIDPVTDPIDKRGKGRKPTKRKGYANDQDRNTKRTKNSTNVSDAPHGFQGYPPFSQPFGMFHNAMYNPPYPPFPVIPMHGQRLPFQPSSSSTFNPYNFQR